MQPASDTVQTAPATAVVPATLDREGLLAIFIDEAPSARSPYGLYDYPPMWAVATRGEETLFARPGRTMTRVSFQYVEVEGVHWQVQRGGAWVGQGYQAETATFLDHVAAWAADQRDAA
jgi:hypothetical protein